ncbi:MAG: 50S ribosomal protein L29 [Salibacteraceae bacterium]|jgi:large subunit ribosomal protein L29|nr:50S ribosomal protein L29 [Salibacteraceae bacterium]MDP4686616.1 50S ribosomal protein L29 [Salibacteraceae bacterium]MDP4764178.1 50S ribosomal protein L29 [Salibacteraceae bacterium]MDP4843304.1 50S ribosomal protein L29 [Salibacteraceae bacterium]MDP4935067.1 50S ribosomal protein L29 [Salibacteraceae bacterium]
MKPSVIREMTTEEVADQLAEVKASVASLRMQHAISPLENPIILRDKKKVVARLMTELTKRSKEAQL